MAELIERIHAREVLDSRGNPTVEVDAFTSKGFGRAAVPSGASAGVHEALELRDGGKRFKGKGVLQAVRNVNETIAPALKGFDAEDQRALDDKLLSLDGTPNKSKLGANAILPVSIACLKAVAAAQQKPVFERVSDLFGSKPKFLPVPQLNIMNGGAHAGMENDVQEHMIMPTGAKSFSEAVQMASEVYHELKSLLKKKFGARGTLIGDEGGFVPPIDSVEERLETIQTAIDSAGYGGKFVFAIDAASSEFFKEGVYTIKEKKFSSGELVDFYASLASSFDIASLEDGMAEDDWEGWVELTKKLGDKMQVVGDDLLVTNPQRIKQAIEKNAANSVLIKVNQIGSVSETLEAVRMAHEKGWSAVVSHRSGETEDPFIADLVVGVNAGQSKFGAPARSDRNAKYNELLRIEELLADNASYPGSSFREINK